MSPDSTRSPESVLRGLKGKEPDAPDAAAAKQALDLEAQHRREWFARFASERLLPMLRQVVDEIGKTGGSANCRLNDAGEALAAELVIVPPNLPKGARPPRLAISAATGERALAIDYTGTFPYVGATGGYGAEIDYDTIYPSQIDEKLLDFVALATGA